MGRVIHTGQVVIDLTLRLKALPEPGGDVFADDAGMHVGGGYNVLYAARQLKVETLFAGTMGSGPFTEVAVEALAAIGARHVGAYVPGDLGYCVAITDANAERTFISTRGAETRDPLAAFDDLIFEAEDVLYISGYSLENSGNRRSLERLVERLTGTVPCRVVFDVSPVVGEAPLDALEKIADLHALWSVNEREAAILAERLGIAEAGAAARSGGDAVAAPDAALARALSAQLGEVLVRVGSLGTWYCVDGGEVVHVPALPVQAVDSNGAGDAHSGVLCAALARGMDLAEALRWANVAGALSTTAYGPATCPSEERIREAVALLR
ncbi:PfkB family carbohydrate kinase [Actinobaculum sp. 352]|uniref:PfkB family carbohydrate kinase n=1 Tax=Actinobaculum sp. 352 TaxID=2490946 RepID=UPI000F7DC48A|nr:PfkB family carbohydrate kinase [Actinobaculum sp. 352]RTE48292.1 kinase [Actinobaculum sp. 352]